MVAVNTYGSCSNGFPIYGWLNGFCSRGKNHSLNRKSNIAKIKKGVELKKLSLDLGDGTKVQMNHIHTFEGDALSGPGAITHVRLNIYPDGGISRLRIFGTLEQEE